MQKPSEWSQLRAPDLSDLEELAQRAFEGLPERFRKLCEGVVLRVDDFPDDETLDEMNCETEFDLLGLFRGRGLAQGEAFAHTGQMPNMVWLYRRPILDYWADHEDTLGDIVRHVLVHEIGHHFGLSDDDMDRIEREADGK
jgi:predicted Zn-dependent protease with MMP-like domain